MQIYNVYQSGKRLYIDEKENPDNKIVVNKYDNMQQTLKLISDGTLPPRLYWALRNPNLSNKYFILPLVKDNELIIGTDISAYSGLWDMILIGTDDDYIIEGTDIDQSRLTYVSDKFSRLFVRDNYLEELDFEEHYSPNLEIYFDEIRDELDKKINKNGWTPNKFLGTDDNGKIIEKEDSSEKYELPIATETVLGGVKPLNKTEEMTQAVGVDEEGRLYTKCKDITVDSELSEESSNSVQNQVVAKEVKSLKEKDELLDKEVNTLRERNAELEEKNAELESSINRLQIKTTTDKAPHHRITDSANYRVLDFGMEGITKQRTTSGKNRLKLIGRVVSTDSNVSNDSVRVCTGNYIFIGMNFANYKSDALINSYSLTENSLTTNNKYTDCGIGLDMKIKPNTYYVYSCKQMTTSYTVSVCFYDVDGSYISNTVNVHSSKSFLTPKNATWAIIVFHPSIIETDVTYNDIQIEEGTVATDYEPYTGGMPSPNLDYPQEIKLAGVLNEETGRYEIGCCVGNKNWFDLKSENVAYVDNLYKPTITDIENGIEISFQKTRNACVVLDTKLYPNKTYTISCNVSIEADNAIDKAFNVLNVSATKSNWYRGDIAFAKYTAGKNKLKFTTPSDTENIKVYLAAWSLVNDTTGKTTITDFQIEIDSLPTDFIKHASQQFTLTSPVPITKWDKLVKRDGVYGWSIWSLKIIADGSAWAYGSSSYLGFSVLALPFNLSSREAFCNGLINIINSNDVKNNPCFRIDGTYVIFYNNPFYDKSLSDYGKANWNAYLSENPLEIITYADEEQNFIPLPNEEQTLLKNLETYYGVTNVYNEQGCPISITYVNDNKLYVDNKLEQINNALLSLGANI